jgi:hypothetical protein
VLSGRDLCGKLITRPEESHRLWCVVVSNLENFKNEEAMTRVGSKRHSKNKNNIYIYIYITIIITTTTTFVDAINKYTHEAKQVSRI